MLCNVERIGGWFLDNTIGKVKISESKSEFLPCMSHFLGSGVYLWRVILFVERYVCSDEEDDDYMVSRGGAYGGYMGGYYEAGDEGECYTDDSEEDSEDEGMYS